MKYSLTFFCLLFSGYLQAQTLPTLSLEQLKTELNKQDDTLRVVNFWATWCKPCVEELPDFVNLAYQYHTEGRQVKFLLIAVEDKLTTIQNFLQKKPYFQKEPAKKNLDALFYVLTEKDANLWIPAIEAKWEGEIPATLIINALNKLREFYPKQLSHTELENLINTHLKKN